MILRERPIGITIIAVIALVSGILGMWITVAAILGAGLLTVIGGGGGALVGLALIIGSLFLVISPLLHIAFGIGALQLKPWAWLMGVIASIFGVLGGLSAHFGHNAHGGGWLPLLISAGILIYLMQPNIKAAFRG